MRIIRFQLPDENPQYGWVMDDKIGPIEGDIFGTFQRQEAKVSIEDDGPGIPEDQQQTLFDKFQQVKGVGSKDEGSGLGLALVREIVNEHGGRIGVESEPGRGSVFYFFIRQLLRGLSSPVSLSHNDVLDSYVFGEFN